MAFVKRMQPVTLVENDIFTPFLQERLKEAKINPFDQSFENTLDIWISRKYTFASNALRSTLTDSSELWRQLDGLHGIYCMFSHSAMGTFIHILFQKVYSLWENGLI
jgi:hypothetical protein